jgi:hypothetical protein
VPERIRITIEIDAKDLERLKAATRQKSKTQAVNHAVASYLESRERTTLIQRANSGGTDYSMTNEDMEAVDTQSH